MPWVDQARGSIGYLRDTIPGTPKYGLPARAAGAGHGPEQCGERRPDEQHADWRHKEKRGPALGKAGPYSSFINV